MKKTFFAIAMAVVIGFVSAVALCLKALNAQTVATFADGEMKIVVDAGHGGIDGGVSGRATGIKESDLNLEISLRLKEVLSDMGFEVTLTRKTEAGLYGTATKGFKKRDMERRKEIIESVKPSLVISVHQNFYPSKTARGGQVFYSEQNEGSLRLAESVQAQVNQLYSSERVKARNAAKGEYFMLECAPCPSVIVECGFLSNASDEALLTSSVWQKKLAQAIAVGAVGYFADSAA